MTARLPPGSPDLSALGREAASRADRILAELAGLPVEQIERLARLFTPAALRRRRLAERDEALRLMAEAGPTSPSGRELARSIHATLARYAASGWRFERDKPAPAHWLRFLAHRILKLNTGTVPSAGAIRDALAHIAEHDDDG